MNHNRKNVHIIDVKHNTYIVVQLLWVSESVNSKCNCYIEIQYFICVIHA